VAFSVSALVLFGIICAIFIRNKQLKTGHAIVAALFGFMLSQSTAAGPIQQFLNSIAKAISSIAG
jgi:intracellular septation protein A